MEQNKKLGLLLSTLGIISIVLITAGVTYAFFNYAKEGTTENTITTGTITFAYEEVEANGAGIEISEAFPIPDSQGKIQSGEGSVFNFNITSQTTGKASIPYEVTVRKTATSTLPENAVKLYLTEVNGITETALVEKTFDQLNPTEVEVEEGIVEKTLYSNTVPSNVSYNKNFRLRMWIPDTIDFSPTADGQYPYSGKTFTLTVNVYANAEVVTVEQDSYKIGDAVTLSDGSKWHVIENSPTSSNTVTLLSDYNLNSDGTYNTTCGRDINGEYNCSPMFFDSDKTGTYDENDGNNIGYFIKNIYSPLAISLLPGTTNITIPTAEQIALVEGKTFEQNNSISLTNSWLLTTNYWTKTMYIENGGVSEIDALGESVWYVDSANYKSIFFELSHIGSEIGARPVITTLKSNIIETMTSATALTVGESVTAIDGSKWHVLEASASETETVVLLSDYNLNSDGTYNTTCGRSINSTFACSPMAFDTDGTADYDETDPNNIGYFIKNTYLPKVVAALPGTTNIKIPADIPGSETNTWLYTTSYWTSTKMIDGEDQLVRFVEGSNDFMAGDGYSPADESGSYGARPTITTPKTNLLAK